MFVSPALALMAVFVVWPVIAAVRMSFYHWKGFGPMDEFVGLDNYKLVLQDDVFTDAVVHNFTIVVLSLLIQLPLGLALALLLNRRIRGRGLLRTIVFVPYVVRAWREIVASEREETAGEEHQWPDAEILDRDDVPERVSG